MARDAARDPAFTLPVHYIRHLAVQLRGMGVDVERWLAASGLTPAALDDAALSVPHAVFHRLVVDALAMSNEPALGLLVGQRLLASSHGILGYAAMNSGTIRQALDVFERFTRLRISLLTPSLEVHKGFMRVGYVEAQPLAELRRPLLEAVVLTVKNVLDAISMGACRVGWVSFPFDEPRYAALARDMFQCDVRYRQSWAGFSVPVDALDDPLKLADPDAFREAAAICQRELDKLTASESMATRVRRVLLEKQGGFPSLQVTARLFHLTPRTLHRRLEEEGTSFKELLEEVRRTLAVEHLKSGRFSIEEIAYTLGYSDLANFRRAFKRWEGVPPSIFRDAQK